MNKNSKILIVGKGSVVERSFAGQLRAQGFNRVFSSTDMGMDATIQNSVYNFFSKEKPDYVVLSSARSGGIEANLKSPGEFIYHNLESQNNVIHSAYKFGVKKLLFIAGSCVYPKDASQPMKEDCLGTGPLEKTSEPYSIAKMAGISMCQAYRAQYGLNAISVIPATIYGPAVDTDLEKAHVIGALIGKFSRASSSGEKQVVVWGTGKPRREFLYVDDFIRGCLFLMEKYNDPQIINLGAGRDISIEELAHMIKGVSGFQGEIVFDQSKPDGVMQKFLDSEKINRLGWKAATSLEEGIRTVIDSIQKT